MSIAVLSQPLVVLKLQDWIGTLVWYVVPFIRLTLKPLGVYIMTVLVGLAIHAMVIVPLIVASLTKRSPVAIVKQNSSGVLTAFQQPVVQQVYP